MRRSAAVSIRLYVRSHCEIDQLATVRVARTIVRRVDVAAFRDEQPHALLPLDVPLRLRAKAEDRGADQAKAVFVVLREVDIRLRLRVRKQEGEQVDVREYAGAY